MPITIHKAGEPVTVKFSTPQEIIIDHTNDSIRLGDGTTLFTGTTVGSKEGQDVYIINDRGINPLPVVGDSGTLTDGSGSATTSSAQIFAANTSRKYFYLKNLGNKPLWFNFTAAAVNSQPSIELLPNEAFVMESNFISTEAINIRSDSLTQDFVAKEG